MKEIFLWNGYGRLLVCIIEIFACIVTCYKVYKGSGSVFAYKLMAFTLIQAIGFFIIYLSIISVPTTFVNTEGT